MQVNNYYPYGLVATEWVRDGEIDNNFLFQGKELIDQTGWQDFGSRQYAGDVGRWFSTDPRNQFSSPYLAMGNSPVMGVDPDGEFWNLIIGAAIGGTINWATHGAKFNAQGLKYFGVGALAGALSAGIGAGVNVAMAGGSFGAGFAGPAAGISSTGFVAGAATGASAGFTNGIISGTGNGLLGGQTFNQSLEEGLKGGLKQGLAGGITGGIFGGIDAMKKDVNFFTGKVDLDVSSGLGAHGFSTSSFPKNDYTISGKYVGKFEGISVYESSKLGEGAYSGGVTLPGRGIIVGKGAYSKQLAMDLMHHEYGHILQAEEVGMKAFYAVIGKESLASAAMNGKFGHVHNTYWTETWANYLSKDYFGSNYIQSNWFPVQNISFYNLLKLKIASLPL